jgi:hypothetical protein
LELENQANDSKDAVEEISSATVGWWMAVAYASFGAWLLHSFAVRFFFVTIQRLFLKFLVKA